MLPAVYEAVDSGEASPRLFLADFTKGFHFIDHTTDARAGQTRDPSCPPELISLLNVFASDINNFAISHNMKLTLYYQQIKSVSISRGIT